MKRLAFCIALLCAAILSSSSTPSITSAAGAAKKEQAVTRFDQAVELMGVTLKGSYLFVHDDEAMARGEACTYVYKGSSAIAENLVTSFHCRHKERGKVTYFTVRSLRTSAGQYVLTEFQFGGSTEGHVVPLAVD
jgi:hypothetical protein